MNSKIYIYSALCILFFSGAFWSYQYHNKAKNLQQYAAQIQQSLHTYENDAARVFEAFEKKTALISANDGFNQALSINNTEQLQQKPYTFLLFKKDTLIRWSNNRIMATAAISKGFHLLDEGYYYVATKKLENEYSLIALLPVKWKYNLIQENVIKNYFIANESIPSSVNVSEKTSDFVVYASDGTSCFLNGEGSLTDVNHQYQLFVLLIFGILFLCILVNFFAHELGIRYRAEWSLVFFLIAIIGIKYFTTYLDLNKLFDLLPLFEFNLNAQSVLSTSSGDLLINILLLLWLIVFFYKDVRPLQFEKLPLKGRLIFYFLFILSIVIGLLMTIFFHKKLIINSKDSFDFENILYIEFPAVITILSLLLLWFVLFLFNYRIMSNARRLRIARPYRLAILAFVLFITFPLGSNYGLDINKIILPVFLFAFIILNDIFIEHEASYLPWLLTWLIAFSFTSSVLLYKYKRDDDVLKLCDTIKKLSHDEDPKALSHVELLTRQYLKANDSIQNQTQLIRCVQKLFGEDDYLSDNYFFTISDSVIVANSSNARALKGEDGKMTYTSQLPILNPDSSQNFYRLEVYKSDQAAMYSYGTSLMSDTYRGIKNFDRIEYAIYKNKICIERKGQSYPYMVSGFNIPREGAIKEMQWSFFKSEYIGHFEDGTVIVASHKYDGIHKIAYLFAYLFIFLAGISFFIAVLNTFTNIIDGFKFPRYWSLNFKVHLTIVSLVIFACIVIAIITIIYSKESTDKRYETMLEQRLTTVVAHVEHDLAPMQDDNKLLASMAIPLAQTHQIDVNFYDLTGKNINGQEKSMYQKHLRAPLMNSAAFNYFSEGKDMFKLSDNIGKFQYKAGFARILKNGQTFAYVELPQYGREEIRQSDLSDLMGTLVTVYVLLLIPTIVFAYMTTSFIMKPIQEIGEKLKAVEFGALPTKIEWASKDELGDLIREYNNMLIKLDESAKLLRDTAKEDAWREMALQISHDIKNPLTPMQLSVQMLSIILQGDDDEAIKSYSTKATRTLQEQIKNLERIATNFGDYANNNIKTSIWEDIDVNEFVKINAELYETNEHPNTSVHIVVPKEPIIVRVDIGQMSRVINNLIKNAIQAIPDNREGRVDVFVYEQSEKVLIRISDNGVGVPSEQMEKIFQPNFTTKGTGSGIGLANCRNIVREMKGRIYCESVLGQGSDFFVELPIWNI